MPRPLSLKHRFYLSLGLLILVVVAIGFGLALVYEGELTRITATRVQMALDQIAEGADAELQRASLLAASAAQSDSLTLVEDLGRLEDPVAVLRANRDLSKRLDLLFGIVRSEVRTLLFFRTDGTVEVQSGIADPETCQSIRRSAAYRQAMDSPGSVIFDSLEPVLTTVWKNQYQIAVAIHPDPGAFPGVEMVYLAMVPQFFNRILTRLHVADAGPEPPAFYAILKLDGTILYPTLENRSSMDPQALELVSRAVGAQETSHLVTGMKKSYLVVTSRLNRVPWKIVYFTDWAQLTAGAAGAEFLALILLFSVILAFVLFFRANNRALLVPLDLLTRQMRDFANGKKPLGIPPMVSAEFHQVFGQFARMVEEIECLTKEKIEAERVALQFQINPHFLANTLSALRFMAMMSKAEGMQAMVEALMDMMSYQLSVPAQGSTVDLEVQNIRRYEYIMKGRYGDTFDLEIQIEPGLGGHPLLTMLLQPIVENSIEHGIRSLGRRGHLSLRVYRAEGAGPAFLVSVRDNGRGIDAQKVRGILEADALPVPAGSEGVLRRGRIGLQNVHRRIRSHYGADYGLTVTSEEGQFTEVVFRLPLQAPREVSGG